MKGSTYPAGSAGGLGAQLQVATRARPTAATRALNMATAYPAKKGTLSFLKKESVPFLLVTQRTVKRKDLTPYSQ
jgi:hypothetical protein